MFTTSSPSFCIEPSPYFLQILSWLVVVGYLKIGWIPILGKSFPRKSRVEKTTFCLLVVLIVVASPHLQWHFKGSSVETGGWRSLGHLAHPIRDLGDLFLLFWRDFDLQLWQICRDW